jgi:hypothetical protein
MAAMPKKMPTPKVRFRTERFRMANGKAVTERIQKARASRILPPRKENVFGTRMISTMDNVSRMIDHLIYFVISFLITLLLTGMARMATENNIKEEK